MVEEVAGSSCHGGHFLKRWHTEGRYATMYQAFLHCLGIMTTFVSGIHIKYYMQTH
jgi:hypothetical protein